MVFDAAAGRDTAITVLVQRGNASEKRCRACATDEVSINCGDSRIFINAWAGNPRAIPASHTDENNSHAKRRESFLGAPAGIRTPDTLLKRQVLCLLSYWGVCGWDGVTRTHYIRVKV